MAEKDKWDGDIRMPNWLFRKYFRDRDKLHAWLWLTNTRNYETGEPTLSVRELGAEYGWSPSRSHRFIAEHFRNTSGTPIPHEQEPDKEKWNKSGTLAEHPTPETILLTNKQKTKLQGFALPEWIDVDAWNGFVEMRKRIKKPMTERAMNLKIALLKKFKERGHDPNAILDKSTENSWNDLYEPKISSNGTEPVIDDYDKRIEELRNDENEERRRRGY